MASEPSCVVTRQFQTLFSAGTPAGMSDRQLLETFELRRGTAAEAAFEALVRRHGPSVLRVCRGVLGNSHDVEDAFQATFLVLACQAHAIRRSDALGSWLFGVARRVAMKARGASARRQNHERKRAEQAETLYEASRDEDWPALYEEIDRLPEKYRVPIVLCYIEGLAAEEAAGRLQWPIGTVHSRLSRARERLRARLTRRGLGASAGAIVLPRFTPLALPEGLVEGATATVRGAPAGSPAIAVAASERIASLAKRVLRDLLAAKLWGTACGLLGFAALVLGAVLGASGFRDEDPAEGSVNPPREKPAPAKPVPSKAAAPKSDPPTPSRSPGQPERRVVPVTIAGRATDEGGKPVAGAAIYITDANGRTRAGDGLLLARATTGPDGRYVARNVRLPVWQIPTDPLPTIEQGKFQVAGSARGFGYSWCEVHGFRPSARPAKVDPEGAATVSYEGEPMALDLTFGPPSTIRGRITNDQGGPIAGAKVQVGYTDSTRSSTGSGTWNCATIDPKGGDGRSFDGIAALPERLRSTKTGADGSYRFDDLPREAKLLLLIDPGPTYDPVLTSIATSAKPLANFQSLGVAGTLDKAFEAPRTVRVKATRADSGTAAAGVVIRAKGKSMRRDGAVARTDAQGLATLRIPPGQYTLALEPPFGMPYLLGERALAVAKQPNEQSIDVRLDPGAVVALEASVAGTGEPVAGVGFESMTDTTRTRRELPSQTVFVDHPTTDASGKLRAVVVPGTRRFLVAAAPPGYTAVRDARPMLDLAAGETTSVAFAFKKTTEPAGQAAHSETDADPVTRRLSELSAKQRQLARRGAFRGRRYYYPAGSISPAALTQFLETLDPGKDHDLVALLKQRFPDAPVPSESRLSSVVDGRRREATLYRNGSIDDTPDNLSVFNGKETIAYSASNAQVNISDRAWLQISTLADYGFWPLASEGATGKTKLERAGGRVSLENEVGSRGEAKNSPSMATRLIADEATGFIYHQAIRSSVGDYRQERWQFGPKTHARGAIVPSAILEFTSQGGEVSAIWVRVLDALDLEAAVPPESFVVSVPAGTLVLDDRGGGDDRNAYRGVMTTPVTDIVAEANRIALTRRPRRPFIREGVHAPRIRPAAWITSEGEAQPPALEGKVVLVNFWGIGCGPCVAQLPEVRAAAKHFAGTDLVLVGLHDSSGTAKEVAAFAKARDLNYLLAIDRPSKNSDSFGATFNTFGVNTIPSAAVLDRNGRVAFVGRFDEAMKKAASLLETSRGD